LNTREEALPLEPNDLVNIIKWQVKFNPVA